MLGKAVCLSESRQGCQIRDVICAQRYSTAFLDGASVKKTIIKELIRTIICFLHQHASIDFQLNTYFAWLYNVSKSRSVHSLRERLLATGKMPQRSRRSLVHRERIVRGFEDQEEDYDSYGHIITYMINGKRHRGALYQRGQDPRRPRDGRNNVHVDDEMRDLLEEIINENCLLTLPE